MRIFYLYLREHAKEAALFLLCSLTFLLIFALYRLPLAAVVYPALICLGFAAVFIAAGFKKYREKHMTLQRLCKIPENLREVLEQYENQTDEDYRQIIDILRQREGALVEQNMVETADLIDYYTTWVHQIKTPIASMRLTLQAEDSAVSRKLSEDLFRIEQYVEMVLTYLRLDSVSTDYVFKECSLDKILKGCLRKFAGQFIGKGIRLEYSDTEKDVLTDEKWLSFVIEQILSNAVKYTPEGSVSVYVEEPETLCIKDTGIGIDASDLPRIFEKGYTGCNGRTDNKASGLGLYLCKRICDNLGHDISAYSDSSQGGTIIKIDLHKEAGLHE